MLLFCHSLSTFFNNRSHDAPLYCKTLKDRSSVQLMSSIKKLIISSLKKCGIHVYRAMHESDFQLSRRIEAQLIKQAKGILHIGANKGQESEFYYQCGSPVLWIEADPGIFLELQDTIQKYPQQKAICALLGSENLPSVKFNLASNGGASSSIYLPKVTQNPFFKILGHLELEMKRLDSVISSDDEFIYDHWVVDVQGAELPVLKGSGQLFKKCNSLIVEAKHSASYSGGTNYHDLETFLIQEGFLPIWDLEEGTESNVLFIRVNRLITT